ncbi:MAG: type III-A CRISPR-associated protein Csm2 [Candidatus Thermoplasmatota archaeon]
MEDIKKLIEEGKHIEFVENLAEIEKNLAEIEKDIRKARNEKQNSRVKDLEKQQLEKKKEQKDYLDFCEKMIKEKETKKFLSFKEKELIDFSCILGIYLVKKQKMKTTQIRKILDGFSKIEDEGKEKFDRNKLLKLKPLLAYTSAKNKSTAELVRIIDNAINEVNTFEDFKKICDFLRGVVAYHKLAGGGD